MNILRELLYGNIHPYENQFKQTDEKTKLLDRIMETDKKFLDGLPPEKIELYEKCISYRHDLSDENELSLFVKGFRLGAQLMLAAIYDQD